MPPSLNNGQKSGDIDKLGCIGGVWIYSPFWGGDSPSNGERPDDGDLPRDDGPQGMVTAPGSLIVPEMGSPWDIVTVLEMVTILAMVTILNMVSILWMVTVLRTVRS